MQRQFWMVQGNGPATQRHHSQEKAEREAERLARQNPGVDFFVMEAVAVHCRTDVVRVNLRDDQVPF